MSSEQFRDSPCWEFLLTNQNSNGGWGYHAHSSSAVEATGWALIALVGGRRTSALTEACARAREWLLKAQRADGSWPAYPGQPQGCWVTSVAARALVLYGGAESAVERGRQWLLATPTAEGTIVWRLRQALFPSPIVHQDSSLRGWSWTPGTASWVEPTAQALLFLRSLPRAMLPSRAEQHRQLAERMLYDRMCPGGGWNSGNPLIYGVAGVPRIGPTAWALLALREQSERREVKLSLQWLESAYSTIHGPASLALAYRCLVSYGRFVAPLAPALEKAYSQNHFLGNVLTAAWVMMALNEEGHCAVPAAGKAATP